MHFFCNRQELLEAVNNVSRAVSAKSTLGALEGILLRAAGDGLFLAGYNMELGITTTVPAQVRMPGELVITAKLFGDIVRRLPADTVELRVDDKLNTTIVSGETEFTIMGISTLEYPELPKVEDAERVEVPQSVLHSMIRQTLFAVAQTDARPVHKGTLFEVEPDSLRLVSVDGSRLAIRTEALKNEGSLQFVIPGTTLNEMLKLMDPESDDTVAISIGRRHAVMDIGNYAVISRLLDGEFMPYRKAILPTASTTIGVNTREMIAAVDRASLVINDRIKSPLICEFRDNSIKISCTTPLGSAFDKVNCRIDGKSEDMGFNSRFLMDALKNSESDEVKIELNGPQSPMKVLPPEGDSFLFLVLPVRLSR